MTYWHDDPATHPPVGTWMWHLHHEILCEPLTEILANRLAYIREVKAKHETPEQIALRLRLIEPVRGTIPATLAKAWAAYDKAWATLAEAWAAYAKARAADLPALEALHQTEHPDCPWNGRSIFGEHR